MFYTINQNNSGGYFIRNEHVDGFVIVEANTPYEAVHKLNKIVEDYSEYCECCGERWSYGIDDFNSVSEQPTIFNKPIKEYKSWWNSGVVIYYLDGRKEIVELKGEL